MKTLFVLTIVMVVLFLATPNKVEAQKRKASKPKQAQKQALTDKENVQPAITNSPKTQNGAKREEYAGPVASNPSLNYDLLDTIKKGDANLLDSFLAKSADPNTKDPSGYTTGVGVWTAAAPQNTAIPNASEVAAPPTDTPTIEPSKVKFLLAACRKWKDDAMMREVHGIVAREIDLSNDLTARQLLQMGTTFAQEKCPSPYPHRFIYVRLRQGDPATFTNFNEGFRQWVDQSLYAYPSDAVVASTWERDQPGWIDYRNFPKALKEQQIVEAARAREREASLEQQRQAEQRKQSEIAARSAAFVKANGVAHFVTVEKLAVNPFVYKGQVVAICGAFMQMNSATQGLFLFRDKGFVVSGIPAARFTQQGRWVMFAGRVLGNIEVKRPVFGPTLVPYLSFVGSAFSQEPYCSDYAINRK